jgi:predicted nuclease of predicted toxin-antitoxin system
MADHYGNHLRETSDVSWIEAVTKRGWVILTKDTSIKRNAAEKAAVCEAKARMFCLSRGNLTGRQMAERFVAHLDRYLAEFDYRYSTRKVSDTERMQALLGRQVAGRRLMYRDSGTATGR